DRVRMMGRIGGMLTAHVRNLELDKIHDLADMNDAMKGATVVPPRKQYLSSTAFFHMLSNPSDADVPAAVPPHPFAHYIANVRTDLDVFGDIEIDALIYQGYQLTDRFVRKHLKCDVFDAAVVAPAKIEPCRDDRKTGVVLEASSKLIGRWAAIYP